MIRLCRKNSIKSGRREEEVKTLKKVLAIAYVSVNDYHIKLTDQIVKYFLRKIRNKGTVKDINTKIIMRLIRIFPKNQIK